MVVVSQLFHPIWIGVETTSRGVSGVAGTMIPEMHSIVYFVSLSINSSQPLVWVSAFCDLKGQPPTLTPGDGLPDSFVRNWVTYPCLSVDMYFTNGVHPTKPLKARSRSPLWISPDCFFALPLLPRCHIENPCSSTLPLSIRPLKNPRYPCNFRCNVYLAEWGIGGGGVRRAEMKKSLTHKQFGLHWRVNMYKRVM